MNQHGNPAFHGISPPTHPLDLDPTTRGEKVEKIPRTSSARPSLSVDVYDGGGGGGGSDNRFRSLARKGSTYEPDEGSAVVFRPPVVGSVAAMKASP